MPLSGRTVVFRSTRGAYHKAGHLFTELTGDLVRVDPIASDLPQVGFFFDDPTRKPPERCRYAVGVLLPQSASSQAESSREEELSQQIVKQLSSQGYRVTQLPVVDHVVHASFPNRGPVAVVIASKRVYPLLRTFVSEHKLCAHPALEVYSGEEIVFLLPLSKQDDFYLLPEGESVDDDDEDDEGEGEGEEGEGESEGEEEEGETSDDEALASESDRCSNSEADHEEDLDVRRKFTSSSATTTATGEDRSANGSRKTSASSFEEISAAAAVAAAAEEAPTLLAK